jgi:hypothetical protein
MLARARGLGSGATHPQERLFWEAGRFPESALNLGLQR